MTSSKRRAGASIALLILVAGLCTVVSAVEFAGGTGDPNDPYQIATVEQLIAIGSDLNLLDKDFVLVADINLDRNLPGGKVFTQAVVAPGPVDPYGGNNNGRFAGRFDGNHHAIQNLRILTATKGSGLGLFGYIGAGACVENLRLERAEVGGGSTQGLLAASNGGTISNCTVAGFIHGKDQTGGLVGENGMPGGPGGRFVNYWPGRIERCGVTGTVQGTSYVGGLVATHRRGSITCSWADCDMIGEMDVGGLVGVADSDEISFCYARGHIAGDNSVGGLIGENRHAVISGCYAQAEVSGNYAVGGLIAENQDGTICCCYSASKVSGKHYPAGLIATNRSGVVHQCYWDREIAGAGLRPDKGARTTSQMQSAATFDGWGFLGQWTIDDQKDYPRLAWQDLPGDAVRDAIYSYGGGTGEPNAPYQIQTAQDLMAMCRYAGHWDKHFVLTRDIDLTPADVNSLTPIGLVDIPFTGVFDGNDHTIRGLGYNRPSESYVALFRYVGRADADANAPNGVVRNLHLDQVDIAGADWVAGFVGLNRGLIESCSVSGSLASAASVAGLAAYNVGTVTSCRTDVFVLRSQRGIGGLGDVGGLVARNEGRISNSLSAGHVDGSLGAPTTGGLVGSTHGGEIENSCSSAQVDGFWSAAGLVGHVSGAKITGCYACGSVKSSGSDTGSEWAGGLVASMSGVLISCYATGSVSGNECVGALVADNGGTIVSCYATGQVTGPGVLGGLVATDFQGVVYLSYWDPRMTGLDTSDGGTPGSAEQMTHAATFRGWGAGGHWKIDEGRSYPRLSWEEAPGMPIVDEPHSYAGGTGTANDPYQIGSAEQLAGIGWYWEGFDKCFVLTADIDMASIDPNTVLPIGTKNLPFTGLFDGSNYTISNLSMRGPRGHFMGLFGAVGGKTTSQSEGQVLRLCLVKARVSGRDCTAILAGDNHGTVADCRVTGTVEGHWEVGGLAGQNDGGIISRCSSSSDISGDLFTGGLVGSNYYAYVYDSCCRGNISGTRDPGGLAGGNTHGTFSNCYSTCNVSSTISAAGLVAENEWSGTLEHCYFAGRLAATKSVAGLVLTNSTAPLAHPQQGTLQSCFWDIESSGAVDGVLDQDPGPAGAFGLPTAQMQTAATFGQAGWDFADTWMICEGKDYPRLRWEGVECEGGH